MTAKKSLFEIAVCDPQGVILADSEPDQHRQQVPAVSGFRAAGERRPQREDYEYWLAKSQRRSISYPRALGVPGQQAPAMYVRVVVYPRLIEQEMIPTIQSHADDLNPSFDRLHRGGLRLLRDRVPPDRKTRQHAGFG